MDAERVSYYGPCDEAIQAMNRWNLEAFGRLKMASWDRINIIRTVVSVYRESAMYARRRYRKVAYDSYIMMLMICGFDEEKAKKMARKAITMPWVDEKLRQTDYVTLYRFESETERKAYRTAETLEVTENRDAEINKALRNWSQQLGQYAINFTDYGVYKALQDAGVDEVEWITMRDEKTCHDCGSLDGLEFSINEIPPKPHLGCRCRLRPILGKKKWF